MKINFKNTPYRLQQVAARTPETKLITKPFTSYE